MNTIYQPSSIVMNKPARNINAMLRISSVILLPAPEGENAVMEVLKQKLHFDKVIFLKSLLRA